MKKTVAIKKKVAALALAALMLLGTAVSASAVSMTVTEAIKLHQLQLRKQSVT